MSNALARIDTDSRSTRAGSLARRTRAGLRVVPALVERPSRAPFVVMVLTVLGVGLLGLLLLNTHLQQNAFRTAALTTRADDAKAQEQELSRQVQQLQQPSNLATRALQLGMVPNPNPVFLRLSDGRVLGERKVASSSQQSSVYGPPLPRATSTPTPTPAAQTAPTSPTTRPPTAPPNTAPSTAARSTQPGRVVATLQGGGGSRRTTAGLGGHR